MKKEGEDDYRGTLKEETPRGGHYQKP